MSVDINDEKLQQLEKTVENLDSSSTRGDFKNKSSFRGDDQGISLKYKLIYYGSPFLFILLILLYLKPSFITKKIVNEEEEEKIVMNYKMLLIVTLIATAIIDYAIYYFYLRKLN
tara:strand:+ start:42 stop:386 length:345 start_codon:yes stop_codon:yes gene_type:complete